MFADRILPFALAPADLGCRNQILGAFRAINELTGEAPRLEDSFVLPKGSESYDDVKIPLIRSNFRTYKDFKDEIFACLDAFLLKASVVPCVFITVYNPTESAQPAENADALCRAVKEYYAERGLGVVMTVILTARYHKYKYIDLINIPKHLMTFALRIRLLQHKKLRKKVLITIGTINNFSNAGVKEAFKALQKKLEHLKTDSELAGLVDKFERYRDKKKHVVFCLGGRVEGSEIVFDMTYAQKLLADAKHLAAAGYGVVFVNGPRTPNNVTDYLFEKAAQLPDIIFQNSKKIASSDDERTPAHWRIYSGQNEAAFRTLAKLGNVYPGVLGWPNTLVVHTMDSYSGCETAGAAIPTAISKKGLWIDPVARYDCHNLEQLLCPRYAIDFDEFVNLACNMKVEPKNLHPQVLSSPLHVFAETVINRLNKM